jgi:hypothetical protein
MPLLALVRDFLGHEDPLSGHLFVFRNKSDDRLKVIRWDIDGLAWFRNLSAAESEKLSAGLTKGVERGAKQKALKLTEPMVEPKSDPEQSRPWAHPRYRAAFVLIGDAH